MSNKTISLDDRLYEYMLSVSLREPDVLARLRAETRTMPNRNMQIAPEQGQFMALLVELIGARRILEVGTFTGYSAAAMARAMAPGGRLTACDVSREYTDIARRWWREIGVEDRIDLRLGPAAETLRALLEAGEANHYDFVFIDADKQNYETYYALGLELLRPGGIIAIDNTLRDGKVADPAVADADTEAMRRFNAARRDDARVSLSLVPIGDGLTLARKR